MPTPKMFTKFQFSEEEKKTMVDSIIDYYDSERDEKIGIIGSEDLLDFFIELVGDKIYNKALEDAMKLNKRSMENLESDYYALFKR